MSTQLKIADSMRHPLIELMIQLLPDDTAAKVRAHPEQDEVILKMVAEYARLQALLARFDNNGGRIA